MRTEALSHMSLHQHGSWRHVKAFLSPYNQVGLHLPSRSLLVRVEVQGRDSAPIHKIPSPRCHNRLELIPPPLPPTSLRRNVHHVSYSWSAAIFNGISHNSTRACERQQQAIRD